MSQTTPDLSAFPTEPLPIFIFHFVSWFFVPICFLNQSQCSHPSILCFCPCHCWISQYLSLQVVLIFLKLFKLFLATHPDVFPSFTPHLCPSSSGSQSQPLWQVNSNLLHDHFFFISFSKRIIKPGQFQFISVRFSRITGKKFCRI